MEFTQNPTPTDMAAFVKEAVDAKTNTDSPERQAQLAAKAQEHAALEAKKEPFRVAAREVAETILGGLQALPLNNRVIEEKRIVLNFHIVPNLFAVTLGSSDAALQKPKETGNLVSFLIPGWEGRVTGDHSWNTRYMGFKFDCVYDDDRNLQHITVRRHEGFESAFGDSLGKFSYSPERPAEMYRELAGLFTRYEWNR
ncbi:MAG: hypothetical protein SFW62_10125 [Alphaproteobacteria bacterium]|nr:hypothetical protein [Alphaproteobacteria bacterium]